MVERNELQGIVDELPQKSVFENVWPQAPVMLVEWLRFAEREGYYTTTLSPNTRRMLEMRYVEGLNFSQIGDVLDVSKQAVCQDVHLAPESLYKRMSKDSYKRRTSVSFIKVLSVYSNYRIELDASKKPNR